MALNFLESPFSFIKGLDQGTDEKLVTGPLRLDNMFFRKNGSIAKRRGFDLLTSGSVSGSVTGVLDPVVSLGVREDMAGREELVALTSGSMFSYSSALSRWIRVGQNRRVSVEVEPLSVGTTSRYATTMAITPTIRASGWIENFSASFTGSSGTTYTRAFISVEDRQTGARFIPPTPITDVTTGALGGVRTIATRSGYVYFIYVSGQSLVYRRVYDRTPWTLGSEVTIEPAGSFRIGAISHFDACYSLSEQTSSFDEVRCAYIVTGSELRVKEWNADQGIDAPSSALASSFTLGAVDVYAITASYSSAVIYRTATSEVRMVFVDAALGSSGVLELASSIQDASGNQVQYAIPEIVEPGQQAGLGPFVNNVRPTVHAHLEYLGRLVDADNRGVDDNKLYSYIRRVECDSTPATGSSTIEFRHAEIATRPFRSGSIRLMGINLYTDLQSHTAIAEIPSGTYWARFSPDISAYTPVVKPFALVTGSRSELVEFPHHVRHRFEAVDGRILEIASARLASVDMDPEDPPMIPVLDGLVVLGGRPQWYDGERLVELGFSHIPEMKDFPTSSFTADTWPSVELTATGVMGAGTRLVSAMYTWTDALGREHRSSPSLGATVVTTGSAFHNLVYHPPTVTFTDKPGVVVELYRSTDGTINQYLVSSGTAALRNDTQAHYVSFLDSRYDDEVTGNKLLYSQGAGTRLAAESPPNSRIGCVWDSRLWLVDEADGLTLWFTQEFEVGLGPEFNSSLTVMVPPEGGRVTAIAGLEGRLVVFKESSVFVMGGVGPDSTGASFGYDVPVRLAGDIGCSDQRSVTDIRGQGIAFMSQRGIHMLDRNLGISFIGMPVEDESLTGLVGTSQPSDLSQVRWGFRDGRMLVLDTDLGLWTRYLLPSMSCVTTHDGVTAFGSGTGQVYRERLTGSFTDGNAAYESIVQTPWLQFAGPQGYQSVLGFDIKGRYLSDHLLSGAIDLDFQAGGPRSTSFTASMGNIVNVASGTSYEMSRGLRHTECEAVRVTLRATQSSGSQEDLSLEGLRFQWSPIAGMMRRGRGRKIP